MEHIFYQNPDGSFNREVTGNSSPSPFFTTIIAQGLALLPRDSGFAAQQQAAISYLLSQQSPQRSYNYLPRTSNESLYPDDLDDTASALTALSLDSPSHINGESWAHIVTLLTATELEPGGPYRTWLVPKDAPPIWNDVDLVVNCNIEYLLTLHNITLPKLKEFIALPRTYEEISSPYYPDKMVIYYFLSRVLSHTLSKPYIALIKDQKASNPLQAALKILTLSNLGANILLTLKEQKVIINTPWKAEPFCLDFGSSTTQYMAGSAELTTIFCLQAQDLLRKASEAPFTTSTSSPEKSIRRLLNDRFMQCEEPLR